jgi:NAD(P)-dependent dehydrogenase (short-subunit alcohol dehydrogenase family)
VTAQLAADYGVIVNDVDAEQAELSAKQVGARGGEAVPMVGDIGGWGAADQLMSRIVDRYGRLDGLVSERGSSSAIRVHRVGEASS